MCISQPLFLKRQQRIDPVATLATDHPRRSPLNSSKRPSRHDQIGSAPPDRLRRKIHRSLITSSPRGGWSHQSVGGRATTRAAPTGAVEVRTRYPCRGNPCGCPPRSPFRARRSQRRRSPAFHLSGRRRASRRIGTPETGSKGRPYGSGRGPHEGRYQRTRYPCRGNPCGCPPRSLFRARRSQRRRSSAFRLSGGRRASRRIGTRETGSKGRPYRIGDGVEPGYAVAACDREVSRRGGKALWNWLYHRLMPLEELLSVVETLRGRIAAHGPALRQSEALTRYALIDPLLRGLSWDTADPSQVLVEYHSGGGSADYALLGADGKPRIIVEAKRLARRFRGRCTQGINYCIQQGIPYFAADRRAALGDVRDLSTRSARREAGDAAGSAGFRHRGRAWTRLALWRPSAAVGEIKSGCGPGDAALSLDGGATAPDRC